MGELTLAPEKSTPTVDRRALNINLLFEDEGDFMKIQSLFLALLIPSITNYSWAMGHPNTPARGSLLQIFNAELLAQHQRAQREREFSNTIELQRRFFAEISTLHQERKLAQAEEQDNSEARNLSWCHADFLQRHSFSKLEEAEFFQTHFNEVRVCAAALEMRRQAMESKNF